MTMITEPVRTNVQVWLCEPVSYHSENIDHVSTFLGQSGCLATYHLRSWNAHEMAVEKTNNSHAWFLDGAKGNCVGKYAFASGFGVVCARA